MARKQTKKDDSSKNKPVRARAKDQAAHRKQDRWIDVLESHSSQDITPHALLVLVEMGLRSGVLIPSVYQALYDRDLIDIVDYMDIMEILYAVAHNVDKKIAEDVIYKLSVADNIPEFFAPALSYALVVNIGINDDIDNYFNNGLSSILSSKISPVNSTFDNIYSAFMKTGSFIVGSACAKAIGRLGPAASAAVPGLVNGLYNEHRDMREMCAWALGKIGSAAKSAIPDLMETYEIEKDENPSVASKCYFAIKKIEEDEGEGEEFYINNI